MVTRVEEMSANVLHVEIPSEWAPLGRSMMFRYAERVAEAATLDPAWRASRADQVDENTIRVKLAR